MNLTFDLSDSGLVIVMITRLAALTPRLMKLQIMYNEKE